MGLPILVEKSRKRDHGRTRALIGLAADLMDTDSDPGDLSSIETKIERRTFKSQDLRALRGGGLRPKIVGYAAVFDVLSVDLGGLKERIRPGAFKKSIISNDIRALINHDPNLVLGRTRAGTLSVLEDRIGLVAEIIPPNTVFANDLIKSIDRGDLDQMSFGFRTIKDSWGTGPEGSAERTLIEVDLLDVSLVTFPAYPQTKALVRSQVLMSALQTIGKIGVNELVYSMPRAGNGEVDPEFRSQLKKVEGGLKILASKSQEESKWRFDLMRRRLELAEASL